MEIDGFKKIFDDYPQLNELLETREKLKRKTNKTKKEKKLYTSTVFKLDKVFRKVEKELCKFPFNVPFAVLAAKNRNIDVNDYKINNDNLLLYIKRMGNVWKQLGELLNIFYNNVFSKKDNKVEKIEIFCNVNNDPKIIVMDVGNICNFMENKMSVKDFSKTCRVI